jgi:Cu(I)/Ag(I) efflux system membrane protein CusA/SilA
MIALLGIAAQTASIMMVYLEEGYEKWKKEGRLTTVAELENMTVEHGTYRIRPLIMAVALNILGMLPIIWSNGVGSDVAKRIAIPLWGGMISLTFLTICVIPAIYVIWRSYHIKKEANLNDHQGAESGIK